jgi:hypothetical protein
MSASVEFEWLYTGTATEIQVAAKPGVVDAKGLRPIELRWQYI